MRIIGSLAFQAAGTDMRLIVVGKPRSPRFWFWAKHSPSLWAYQELEEAAPRAWWLIPGAPQWYDDDTGRAAENPPARSKLDTQVRHLPDAMRAHRETAGATDPLVTAWDRVGFAPRTRRGRGPSQVSSRTQAWRDQKRRGLATGNRR
jgi:hypothetical protein